MSIDTLGYIAAFLTTACSFPQAYYVWQCGRTQDMSLAWISMLTLGCAFWAVYGVISDDLPITFANSLSLLLNGYILMVKMNSNVEAQRLR